MHEVQRFSFFPNPVEDETIYSWLARYHLWSGNRSFKRNTLKMLGMHENRPTNEFPCFIPQLAIASNFPKEDIVRKMTPYYYYAPFLSHGLQTQLYNALVSGQAETIHAMIGCVASRLTPGKYLYSCRHCVEDDIEKYGFPIWHLTHQLLGVEVCPIHHEHLHLTKRTNIQARLPKAFSEPTANVTEERYASLILEELRDRSLSLITEQIYNAYYQRICEHGLLTQSHRIRHKSLRKLILSHLSVLPTGIKEYDYLRGQIQKHQYPECLFYNDGAAHHPLKHLVLIEALFESWGDFKEETVKTPVVLTPKATDKKIILPQSELTEEAEQRLINGESLRTVSQSENLSVTTLKILAQQRGIKIDTRPSKIFRDIENTIVHRLELGDKTQDIATYFSISVGAVEQILRKHPQLIPLRKKIWFNQARDSHRHAIASFMQRFPIAGRKQIREALGATYIWLYKHDNEWLYRTLPEAIPRANRAGF